MEKVVGDYVGDLVLPSNLHSRVTKATQELVLRGDSWRVDRPQLNMTRAGSSAQTL